MTNKNFSRYLTLGSFIGMLLGIGLGMLAHAGVIKIPILISWGELFAKVWIVVIITLAIPLIATFLLGSLLQLFKTKLTGTLALRGFGIHVLMLLFAAMVSVILSSILVHGFVPTTVQWTIHSSTAHSFTHLADQLSFIQSLLARSIVPVILITIALALVLHQFSAYAKNTITQYVSSVSQKLFGIIHMVFIALPVSAASLALVITFRNGPLLAGVAGFYVLGVCAILLIFIAVQYGAVYFFGHTPVKEFTRNLLPAQLMAASTCSSLATLPALLVSMKRLGIADNVAGSTVPLFVSFFRVNLMVANPFSFFLLSQLYHLQFEWPTLLLFLGMMMITSFGSPGLPQTGNVYSLPVFLAAGIPIEGVVLLKALDAIPDIFKTVLNITETGAVTSLMVRGQQEACTEVASVKPQLPA